MTNSVSKIFSFIMLGIIVVSFTASLIVSKSVTFDDNVIYLDPGHGGPDGGGVGIGGLYEKDLVLVISKKLGDFLSQAGYKVLYTREGDYDLASEGSKNHKRDDIHKRVKLINDSNCALFVSIHANKYPSPTVYGAQVFYKKDDLLSKNLSDEIQDSIKAILQNTKRIAKAINNKYLIDHSKKTGCIVEVGFITNPNEASLLQSEIYQEKMAYAIYVGITSYLLKYK